MKYHKQLFRHDPANGIFGDCHRTAIACMLDKEPTEVPHFGELYFEKPKEFNEAVDRYLATQGLATVGIAYQIDDLANLEALALNNFPNVFYLLGGRSRSGVNHTVVGCNGVIAHDPSQNDSGIIGPCDDGYYWLTFFVPLAFCAKPLAEAA